MGVLSVFKEAMHLSLPIEGQRHLVTKCIPQDNTFVKVYAAIALTVYQGLMLGSLVCPTYETIFG